MQLNLPLRVLCVVTLRHQWRGHSIIPLPVRRRIRHRHLDHPHAIRRTRHIRQAHEDVEKVQVSSNKISQRFAQIEAVELGEIEQPAALLVVEREEGKG